MFLISKSGAKKRHWQTMESVIPPLVKSVHERKENPITGTMELLFSFVAAFEHIPSQRRLGLFKSLADKLGTTEFLFALLILLLDKYPDDEMVRSFAADLTGAYDALTQLQVSFGESAVLLNGTDRYVDSRKVCDRGSRHTYTQSYHGAPPRVNRGSVWH